MNEQRSLSMPFWCAANPVGDPFGPGVLAEVKAAETAELLAAAGRKGLIHYTAAHDDDLVGWNPDDPEDDLDPAGKTRGILEEVRGVLNEGGVSFKMIGCCLHADPVFRNGGIANPDPRVRILAAQKIMRSLRIGSFLGAEFFTYWVARDGFETQFAVPWGSTYRYIQEALNMVPRYCREHDLSIRRATIEYKPNEPRGEMFLPTIGHAAAMIQSLETPDFWGCNPEVLQHDAMINLSSAASVAFALHMKKLFFLHVGSQKPGQFDNDNPPTIGMDGLKEMVSILYLLKKADWDGYIEFDSHMLRTDAVPGGASRLEVRERFISLAVEAYRLVEQKALDLVEDREISRCLDELWAEDAALEQMLSSCSLEELAGTRIDYRSTSERPLRIGELDLLVNRRIMGR